MAQNKGKNGNRAGNNPKPKKTTVNKSAKPKRRKRKTSPVTVFTMVLFAIILVYLVKYTMDFASGGTDVKIETVDYGNIDIPNSFEGLVVRDEYIVNSDMGGEPSFNYGEGDKVKKNALVCTIKESKTADIAQDKLRSIDKGIIETQKNRVDISKYKDDILRTERSINSSVLSAQGGISAGNYNDVYTLRNAITTQMEIRTSIWINENSQSSDSMAYERRTYQSQLSNSTENLNAPEGGILVLSYDGEEEKFTPENISDITQKDIGSSYNIHYLSKTTAIEKGTPAFKVINSNNWYICSYIENSIAADWQVGDIKTIRASVDKTEKSVETKISEIIPGDKYTYVVFESNKDLQDFLSVRNIEFYISDSSYDGLKIPNSAIVEKTFIKVPSSCVMDSLNGKSVIKRTGGKDELVNIETEYTDDNYVYIRQDFDLLKLGDVILEGTGETASEYKLSEVSTKIGVLTANGAFAEFAGINILGKNSQYTIADPMTSRLKAYDKIISNASKVNEGDEIW